MSDRRSTRPLGLALLVGYFGLKGLTTTFMGSVPLLGMTAILISGRADPSVGRIELGITAAGILVLLGLLIIYATIGLWRLKARARLIAIWILAGEVPLALLFAFVPGLADSFTITQLSLVLAQVGICLWYLLNSRTAELFAAGMHKPVLPTDP